MAGKSRSHNDNPSKLQPTVEISQDKSSRYDPLSLPDQPCPKCNGEGYIVVRVYPWDGCSYDEKPCDLCNPKNDELDF
jgi:hypothetical protein